MKTLVLAPVIILLNYYLKNPGFNSCAPLSRSADTAVVHVLDGKTGEWPAEKFQTDLPTAIRYAADNDEQYLYLALVIPNFNTQLKIVRQGMELYLDAKEKKKEAKGIEFPVKEELSEQDDLINEALRPDLPDTGQQDDEQRKANLKIIKAQMALRLGAMKVFGFSRNEPDEQGLLLTGSANIAFAWDSTDALNIEYRIPVPFLESSSSALRQKEIDLGWKLNGVQLNPKRPAPSTAMSGGRQAGRSNFDVNAYKHRQPTQQDLDNLKKDQSFWTKYKFR